MKRLLCTLWLCSVGSAHAQELGAQARVKSVQTPGVTSIDAAQAGQRPGALGEAARGAFDLPGVARSSFAGSELLVWGAAGSETRSYVDGVELPALFHPGGFRSTVHPALLERLTLIPGAAGAQYGRGLGGALELTARSLQREGNHLTVRADAIDGSLSVESASRPVAVLAAARYGYLDRVVERFAADSQDVLRIPAHMDGALRVEGRLDARSKLTATWLGAHDHSDVQTDQGRQRRENTFQLVMLSLERRYADAARIRIMPFVGVQDSGERSSFSGVPLALARTGQQFGVRSEYTRTSPLLQLRVGLDARVTRERLERTGTLTLPAREGDIFLFGQVPADGVNRDGYRTTLANVAPYLVCGFTLGSVLIEPGLRLEGALTATSQSLPPAGAVPPVGSETFRVLPEPRLRVSYQPVDWSRVEARVGIYHQQPAPEELSAVFGDPTLAPARATHVALAHDLTLPRQLSLVAVGFYRALSDLPVRSAQNPPSLARALTQDGHGRAYGGSLSLQREVAQGLSGALNYTLSRSERSQPDGSLRLFDGDQTHVLSALISLSHGEWLLSIRLRVASGTPRTALVDTYDDVKSGTVQPLFGQRNAQRLPLYQQLDIHLERGFTLGAVHAALFLDLLNLWNHRNVEQIAYSADYSRRRDVIGLPLLAMLGGRLSL